MADDTSPFDDAVAQGAQQTFVQTPGAVFGGDYATTAGPVLDAFDRKISAQRQLLRAQNAQTQTAADLVRTTTQRHAVAAQAAQSPLPGAGGPDQVVSPQETALQQTPTTLSDFLASHSDDDVDAANAEIKAKHGKSADEMYDDLVKNKFIEPAGGDLNNRQKFEALAHIGLEMLSRSTSRNRWTQNPLGAIGAAGEAGLADLRADQKAAAQQAHEEYLNEQGIALKRAEAQDVDEREAARETQAAAAQAAKDREAKRKQDQANAFAATQEEYRQREEDRRQAASLAEKDRESRRTAGREAAEKGPKTYTDDQGYLREQGTGRILSVDEKGNPMRTQRTAEDQAKIGEARSRVAQQAEQQARAAIAKDQITWIDKSEADRDKFVQAAVKRATDRFDESQGPTGGAGGKVVDFSQLPAGK